MYSFVHYWISHESKMASYNCIKHILDLDRVFCRINKNNTSYVRRSIAKSAYCAGMTGLTFFFHCRITWFNLAAGVRSRVARSLKELFHFLYRACSSLLISKFLISFSTFFIFIAIPRYEVNIGFATIVLLLLHLLSFRTILWFLVGGARYTGTHSCL